MVRKSLRNPRVWLLLLAYLFVLVALGYYIFYLFRFACDQPAVAG